METWQTEEITIWSLSTQTLSCTLSHIFTPHNDVLPPAPSHKHPPFLLFVACYIIRSLSCHPHSHILPSFILPRGHTLISSHTRLVCCVTRQKRCSSKPVLIFGTSLNTHSTSSASSGLPLRLLRYGTIAPFSGMFLPLSHSLTCHLR